MHSQDSQGSNEAKSAPLFIIKTCLVCQAYFYSKKFAEKCVNREKDRTFWSSYCFLVLVSYKETSTIKFVFYVKSHFNQKIKKASSRLGRFFVSREVRFQPRQTLTEKNLLPQRHKCPSIVFDYSHSMPTTHGTARMTCIFQKTNSRTPWISPLSKNEQSRVLINGILMLSFGHCVRTYILYNSYKTKTLLEYMIAPSL